MIKIRYILCFGAIIILTALVLMLPKLYDEISFKENTVNIKNISVSSSSFELSKDETVKFIVENVDNALYINSEREYTNAEISDKTKKALNSISNGDLYDIFKNKFDSDFIVSDSTESKVIKFMALKNGEVITVELIFEKINNLYLIFDSEYCTLISMLYIIDRNMIYTDEIYTAITEKIDKLYGEYLEVYDEKTLEDISFSIFYPYFIYPYDYYIRIELNACGIMSKLFM